MIWWVGGGGEWGAHKHCRNPLHVLHPCLYWWILYTLMWGGGGGGDKQGSCLLWPVEPDTSSLWMDLFCLDSVILIIVTCNCLPHISWQVLKIAFHSLQIWKLAGGWYPLTPIYKKNLATALQYCCAVHYYWGNPKFYFFLNKKVVFLHWQKPGLFTIN